MLGGCASVDPSTAQVGMDYSNGIWSGKQFKECTPPGVVRYYWPTDDQFYYPDGTRTINFSDASTADATPLTITTHDGQTMKVNGLLSFHLTTSCAPYKDADGVFWPGGVLQKFHQTVALQQRDVAYAAPDKDPGQGWDEVVAKFLVVPMERGVSNQALNFDSQALFSDPATKAAWEKQSLAEITTLIQQQSGKDQFFTVDSITLLKPTSQVLADGLAQVKAANLRAQAADVDKQTALNFPGGIQGYEAYLNQQAINRSIADGKAQVIVNGGGAPLIAGPR